MNSTSGRGGFLMAGLGFGVALGVAAGTLVLAPNMTDIAGTTRTATASSGADADSAGEDPRAELVGADAFTRAVTPELIAGTLTDSPILLLASSDVDESVISGVSEALETAGAIDAGTIRLKDTFFSSAGADGLRTIAAKTLPGGATLDTTALDSGTHAGQLLGAALLLDPVTAAPQASTDERALVLSTLRDQGYLDYRSGSILPAQGIVLLLGDSAKEEEAAASPDVAASNEAAFAAALGESGGAVVYAAPGTPGADSALAKLRAAKSASTDSATATTDASASPTASNTAALSEDSSTDAATTDAVSTVDSVDEPWAQVAVVLALVERFEGEGGHYGVDATADAIIPGAESGSEETSSKAGASDGSPATTESTGA